MLMWLIVAIILILFFALYPHVSHALARRRILRALGRAMRQQGGKLRLLKKLPILSGNFSRKPDVWIRCGNAQYVVKLWIPKHHRADLRIRCDGKVREVCRVQTPLTPHGEQRSHAVLGLWHSLPKPMVNRGSRAKQSARRIHVLLISPPYARMLLQEENRWRELGGGDRLGGWVVHTPASFASLLHDHAPKADCTSIDTKPEKQTQSV